MPCVPSRKTSRKEHAGAPNLQGAPTLDQDRYQTDEQAVLPEQSIVELSTKVRVLLRFITHLVKT